MQGEYSIFVDQLRAGVKLRVLGLEAQWAASESQRGPRTRVAARGEAESVAEKTMYPEPLCMR